MLFGSLPPIHDDLELALRRHVSAQAWCRSRLVGPLVDRDPALLPAAPAHGSFHPSADVVGVEQLARTVLSAQTRLRSALLLGALGHEPLIFELTVRKPRRRFWCHGVLELLV